MMLIVIGTPVVLLPYGKGSRSDILGYKKLAVRIVMASGPLPAFGAWKFLEMIPIQSLITTPHNTLGIPVYPS